MRVKLAARLRLEREVPQGEYRRHYVLAAGAGQLVDDDEGDEEVRLAPLPAEATATSCSSRRSLSCVSTLCESAVLACSAACRETFSLLVTMVYWCTVGC